MPPLVKHGNRRPRQYTAGQYELVLEVLSDNPSIRDSAVRAGTSYTTAARIRRVYGESGPRARKPRGGAHNVLYNKEELMSVLIDIIKRNNLLTFAEIRDQLQARTRKAPSNATICTWLQMQVLTLKKISRNPSRQNTPESIQKRAEFIQWMCRLQPEQLTGRIYLGEQGFYLWTQRG